MALKVGSARIDEHGHISGGKAGDQTTREVATQAYYIHAKGWICLRPIKIDDAKAIAKAMFEACKNDNIGYDQTNRSAITMLKKYGTFEKITEKTETDCSNLVRGCVYQATGKDAGNFSTADEVACLGRTGLFKPPFEVKSNTKLYNGDILVTKTKGHTVIVVSGNARRPSGTKAPAKDATTVVKKSTDPVRATVTTKGAALVLRNKDGKKVTSLKNGTVITVDKKSAMSLVIRGTKYIMAKVSIGKYKGYVAQKYLKF